MTLPQVKDSQSFQGAPGAAPIAGQVAPGYEPVAEAFAAAFARRPKMGGALAIRVRGELVVSLWGGVRDERSGAAWTEDTPSVVFSCTKGLMALLIAQLVEAGRLDYEARVADIWPEFNVSGKCCTLVRDLLAHRAGLSAPDQDWSFEDLLDWDTCLGRLANQVPLWVPGQGYAYHAITHGWLVGELARRVTGKRVGALFAEQIAEPVGADAWIGRSAGDGAPMAHLQVGDSLAAFWRAEAAKPDDGSPNWPLRAMTLGGALPTALVTEQGGFNDARLQAAEVPGAGGIATALGLATIWSAAVTETNGVRLLTPETVARATQVVTEGPPMFAAEPPFPRWGMGFQLDSAARRFLTETSFGHDGAGGQVAFADPRHEVGFAFVTNWMEGAGDPRGTAIVNTLRQLTGD
jgi:CubicO group peptidase (beta-lactamase class C family)